MHNVNTDAIERSASQAAATPESARQQVELSGEWQSDSGAPQFSGTIAYPAGELEFACDFPPPLGGSGAAPNPLAYCLWGGVACYAMTYAIEAAREGIELEALRGVIRTEVDQSRALGVSERPPVEEVRWDLEIVADESDEVLQELKAKADERCPGVYCMSNAIPLVTSAERHPA